MDSAPSTSGASPSAFDDDARLVEELRRGNDVAYEHLVRAHSGRLLAVTQRIVGDYQDACDALQDTFIQAFKSIDSFEGSSRLGTWLHRIAVNASLMKLRTRRRKQQPSIDDLLPRYAEDGHRLDAGPAWELDAADVLARRELRDRVRACIQQLPDDYRTVLLLRDIEEMDTEQAAQALGISEGAVKTRLHRARQALRTLLEPHMRDPG
jgi:RNA polymerase sigma-70 factor (ECF subfamily)